MLSPYEMFPTVFIFGLKLNRDYITTLRKKRAKMGPLGKLVAGSSLSTHYRTIWVIKN